MNNNKLPDHSLFASTTPVLVANYMYGKDNRDVQNLSDLGSDDSPYM